MEIKSIGKITLYEHLDQDKIDLLLSGTNTIVLDIERQYSIADLPQRLSAIVVSDFSTGTIDYLQSLKNVLDVATMKHEENALIFKINYNSGIKEFDLTNSYVRDSKDTSIIGSPIVTGQLLKAVFSTPGFDGPVLTTIDLPFGDVISSSDKLKLLAIGIELDLGVTGDLFSIKTQSVPFKVSFYQPDSSVENYVIDFPLTNQLIEI